MMTGGAMGGYKEVLESAAKRIRSLERVQKGMLLFAAVLPLAFFAAYFVTTGREGFEYRNAILVPEAGADEGADGTVYAGTINGKPAVFTVSPDKTVEFRYGETIYGPYTVKEDPSAIPKRGEDVKTLAELEDMRGIELYRGDELLFRGGARYFANGYRLYNEEGGNGGFGPHHSRREKLGGKRKYSGSDGTLRRSFAGTHVRPGIADA